METIKVGDLVVITNYKKNIDGWDPFFKGKVSVIDRIDYPFYYLENDNTTPFTKEQLSVISKNKFNITMVKCKKCGSANIKVDFGRVFTSIPAMYEYKCQDCSSVGCVDCCDVDMNCFTPEGFQKYPRPEINIPNGVPNVEDKKEPKVKNNGGLSGWICPKCGRCYSPYTSMCGFCGNGNWNQTITYSTGTTYSTRTDATVK